MRVTVRDGEARRNVAVVGVVPRQGHGERWMERGSTGRGRICSGWLADSGG